MTELCFTKQTDSRWTNTLAVLSPPSPALQQFSKGSLLHNTRLCVCVCVCGDDEASVKVQVDVRNCLNKQPVGTATQQLTTKAAEAHRCRATVSTAERLAGPSHTRKLSFKSTQEGEEKKKHHHDTCYTPCLFTHTNRVVLLH